MNAVAPCLISNRVFDIAERDPERELVFDPLYGRYTYADIADQVQRLACGLKQLGLGKGDCVILQLPNWTPFLVFHLAVTAIGGVTINMPMVFREKEVGNVQRISGAKALVVPSLYQGKRDFVEVASNVSSAAPDLRHVFVVGQGEIGAIDETPQMIDYAAFMAKSWESQGRLSGIRSTDDHLDDLTMMSFTSGTTGEQKGAMLSSRVLSAWNIGLAERYKLDEGERILACSPFGHAVGLAHALRMTFTLGASLVLQEKWNPDQAIQLISQERCTFMAGATPFLMDVVYNPGLANADMSSMRLFICGGASIPEKLLMDAQQALPDTFTTPLWGMTECGGATTCSFDAPLEKLHTTDGNPCGDMEVKVVDEQGQEVPPGVEGELMARGSMLALGYYQRPELTKECFQEDGYFRTGDQARMDADGYIKITGRIKDLIIRGGVNISPVEIESVLFSHPRIANVAVVGMPDSRLGERVCAFIQPNETGDIINMDDLQSWMQQQGVAKPKWPERIEMLEAFPITQSGKIQKFKLRELIS